jgi:hypothetical protein
LWAINCADCSSFINILNEHSSQSYEVEGGIPEEYDNVGEETFSKEEGEDSEIELLDGVDEDNDIIEELEPHIDSWVLGDGDENEDGAGGVVVDDNECLFIPCTACTWSNTAAYLAR